MLTFGGGDTSQGYTPTDLGIANAVQRMDLVLRVSNKAAKENVMADALSRMTFDPNEWSLSQGI